MGYNGELPSFTQMKADMKILLLTVYNTYIIVTLIYVALNTLAGGLSFMDA